VSRALRILTNAVSRDHSGITGREVVDLNSTARCSKTGGWSRATQPAPSWGVVRSSSAGAYIAVQPDSRVLRLLHLVAAPVPGGGADRDAQRHGCL